LKPNIFLKQNILQVYYKVWDPYERLYSCAKILSREPVNKTYRELCGG